MGCQIYSHKESTRDPSSFGIDHVPRLSARRIPAAATGRKQASQPASFRNSACLPLHPACSLLDTVPPVPPARQHPPSFFRFLRPISSPTRHPRPIPPPYQTMFTLAIIPSITVTPAADDSTTTPTTTAPPPPTQPLSAKASVFPPPSVANLSKPSASARFPRRHSTAAVLPVPPLAAAHDDRVSLAQCGMPVGSFKLNCVESIGALSPPRFTSGQTTPGVASARGVAVAKVFGWTAADGAAEFLNGNNHLNPNNSGSSSGGLSSPRSQSRYRHTRAKSLNSLAELGIPPPHQPSPPPEASSRRSRYRSLGMDMNMNLGETKFSIDLAVLDSTPSPSEQGPQFSFPRRS